MPLTGAVRSAALLPPSGRRRSWLRWAWIISLLLHLAVVLAFLVSFQRSQHSEVLPPPAPVTMVFESGRRSGPTLPEPDQQATPQPPATPPGDEAPSPQPVPSPSPPEPAVPAPSPAVPEPVAPTPIPPSEPPLPAPAPPSVAPLPPLPETPAAPEPAPSVPQAAPKVPPPPLLPAPPLPGPLLPAPLPRPEPPVPQPQPPAARPQPALPAPARPAKPPPPTDAFPPLINYSFGRPIQPARPARPSGGHRRGTIDMSLGPASKGLSDLTPYGNRDNDAAEADWRNALSRWVSEHAYYPSQAVHELQEGDARVHVVMRPDGKVTGVELIGRSGSVWLDAALMAMFRDARLPPLPGGETDPLEFNFTMHYILRRMP